MKRQEAAAHTREALIEAGLELAESTDLSALSVNLVVNRAGVAKGTFFHHFADRAQYLVAVHRAFHDRLVEEFLNAVPPVPHGARRLRLAAEAYLDACLRRRGVRALLLQARAEAAVRAEVGVRNAAMADLLIADFQALGCPHPRESARLWVAAAAETAVLEFESGGRDPALRQALVAFPGGPAAD